MTLIVVMIVVFLFVAIGCAVFYFHYKRKLPPAFYNIGRWQWKNVPANEEPLEDGPIVKNGKKPEVTETGPTSEEANVNPSLTTVTWTAENGKANGTSNGTNGTSNGTNGTATNGDSKHETEPLNSQD